MPNSAPEHFHGRDSHGTRLQIVLDPWVMELNRTKAIGQLDSNFYNTYASNRAMFASVEHFEKKFLLFVRGRFSLTSFSLFQKKIRSWNVPALAIGSHSGLQKFGSKAICPFISPSTGRRYRCKRTLETL